MRSLTIGLAALVYGTSIAAAPAAAPQPPQQIGVQRPAPPRDATPEKKGTAVIRGRVSVAGTGRPLRRARISISSAELGQAASRTTSTDLAGKFEIKDLAPARYRVSVARSGYLPLEYGQRRPGEQGRPVQVADGQAVERIDFALPRMSVISGRVSDESGEPMEGVTVIASRSLYYEGQRRLVPVTTATTDDEGEFRLQKLAPAAYVVAASTKETWTVVDAGKETVFGYTPTYFPGMTAAGAARRISVGLGQQVTGIDLSLIPGRAAKLSGTALDSKQRPFTRVSASEEIRGLNFGSFRGGPGSAVSSDGTFTIANVTPGEYRLNATRLAGDPAGDPEVAEMMIVVDGNDLENLSLTGSVGGTVSGRVVIDGEGAPKWSSLRVEVRQSLRGQPSPSVLGAFRTAGSSLVKEDGSFLVEHVFEHARFQVTLPDGWMLKSVTQGGRDITDGEIPLRSGEELRDVDVTITPRVTTVAGQLTDAKNEPVYDATVVVFATQPQRWFEGSRSVKAARPDQQGQWRLKALPPGDYLAVALEYVEDGSWNDPEYLESLRQYAVVVTLGEGASETVALKVTIPR
ncbi:MAG: carboxypeptidase-like regulatory domain-containing protein [Vicinamibacterales bacterium]